MRTRVGTPHLWLLLNDAIAGGGSGSAIAGGIFSSPSTAVACTPFCFTSSRSPVHTLVAAAAAATVAVAAGPSGAAEAAGSAAESMGAGGPVFGTESSCVGDVTSGVKEELIGREGGGGGGAAPTLDAGAAGDDGGAVLPQPPPLSQ